MQINDRYGGRTELRLEVRHPHWNPNCFKVTWLMVEERGFEHRWPDSKVHVLYHHAVELSALYEMT